MRPRVRVEKVVKTYRRYDSGRPRTWKSLLAGGVRLHRPQRITALEGISFEVMPGESLGIIGRNGAGKSTLLRLVGGVGRADAGTVAVEGRIGSLLELGAGMHPDLSGRDNALLGCLIGGLTRREAARRVGAIAAFAELEDYMGAPLRSYSSGMQMRLGFAVSIHMQPDVLLVDEVLSVGDLPFQRKCMERIAALREGGCAILFATHDLAQAEDVCDRVLWLEHGRPMALDEPGTVIAAFRNAMDQVTRERTPRAPPQAARQADASHEGLVLGDNRLGSQEMRIRQVVLAAPHGETVAAAEAGGPLRVIVRFECEAPVDHPIVGVSFSDDEGRVCLEVSTANGSGLGAGVRGRGEVVLDLHRLDLRAGNYYVDVGLYERAWQYAYDYHWHAYPLEITPAGRDRPGHRSAPHRWTVQPGD